MYTFLYLAWIITKIQPFTKHHFCAFTDPLNQWLKAKKKKRFVSETFGKLAMCYAIFFFFKENELCAMRDFFFYCVFGPLFFFFAKKRKILPLRGKIFHFFSDKQKKKKKLSKARPMRKIGFHIPMRASFWDKPFFFLA